MMTHLTTIDSQLTKMLGSKRLPVSKLREYFHGETETEIDLKAAATQ